MGHMLFSETRLKSDRGKSRIHMRSSLRNCLPGLRLQGVRHSPPRRVVPVVRERKSTQCVYFGLPEFPVSDTYAGRKEQASSNSDDVGGAAS